MRVRFLSGVALGGGVDAFPGEVHDLPEAQARPLVARGKAVPEAPAPAKAAPVPEPDAPPKKGRK